MRSIFLLCIIGILYLLIHFIGSPLENSFTLGWILFFAGIASFLLLFQKDRWLLRVSVILSVVVQISFIFLQDAHNDIYKYLWEGYGSSQGMNIYEHHPWEIYEAHPPVTEEGRRLWEKVNFKRYYTTYPPLPQLVFWLGAEIRHFLNLCSSVFFSSYNWGPCGCYGSF